MEGSSPYLIWRYDAVVFLVGLRKIRISYGMVGVQVKIMNVMTSEALLFKATCT
jgi:ribosomal protein S3